jgi:hypothetical protein
MKTNLSILSIFIGILLFSCKPELDSELKPTIEIESAYGHLRFESRASYEAILMDTSERAAAERKGDYSKHHAGQRQMQVDTINEDVRWFASFLSEKGLIEIGEYLFQVRFSDSTIRAVPISNSSLYDSLADGLNPIGAFIFSFNDDVLDLIEDGVQGTIDGSNQRTVGILCGGGCRSNDFNGFGKQYPDGCKVFFRNRYVKAGIYFELSHHQYCYCPIDIALISGSMKNNYSYTQNCKNGHSRSLIDLNWVYWIPTDAKRNIYMIGDVEYNFKNTIYTNTRGLKNIYLNPSYQFRGDIFQDKVAPINCR